MKLTFISFSIAAVLWACNNDNAVSDAPATASMTAATSGEEPEPVKGKGDCSSFFWFKKGTVLEYKLTSKTGTKDTHTVTTIKDVHQEGPALVADYTTVLDGKTTVSSSYRCEGEKLYMNMKSMFNDMLSSAGRSGMELEVKDDYLSFPWNMKVGDQLDGASFEIKSKQNGKEFMTMTSVIKDRRVESTEKVTTPAGTWNCLKLVEKRVITTKIMGNVTSTKETNSAQWFAPDAGLIKFESYEPDGTVQFTSELVSIK